MKRASYAPHRRGEGTSRGVRRAILLTMAALVVVAVVLIWARPSPDRPTGITGKLVNHGTTNVHEASKITVVLGERSFSPTFLRGPAGTRFLVHLQAEGFHAHSFTVPSLGIDVTLAPGSVTDVPITIPAASTSIFFCRFHRSQGMQGAIIERSS
jgi:plastocyanin